MFHAYNIKDISENILKAIHLGKTLKPKKLRRSIGLYKKRVYVVSWSFLKEKRMKGWWTTTTQGMEIGTTPE